MRTTGPLPLEYAGFSMGKRKEVSGTCWALLMPIWKQVEIIPKKSTLIFTKQLDLWKRQLAFILFGNNSLKVRWILWCFFHKVSIHNQ